MLVERIIMRYKKGQKARIIESIPDECFHVYSVGDIVEIEDHRGEQIYTKRLSDNLPQALRERHLAPISEPSYKVGQKVKIIADTYSPRRLSHEIPVGTIVTIYSINDSSLDRQPYRVDKPGGGTTWVTREDIEPVNELSYKIGDRVRQIAPGLSGGGIGDTTTITRIEVDDKDGKTYVYGIWYRPDGTYYVHHDSSQTKEYRLPIEKVELIEEPKTTHTPKNHKPKRGDKFRVIKVYCDFRVGDTVTFLYHTGIYNYFENDRGRNLPMHYQDESCDDEVEPIETEEQGKFKIGDKVKVLDLGKHYSTYDQWAKAVGAKYYKDYQHFENGEIGEIVAIRSHESGGASHSPERILALVRIDRRDLIIGIEGIELYEEKKQEGFPCPSDYTWMNLAVPSLNPYFEKMYLSDWSDTTQEKPKQKEVKNKTMTLIEGDRYRVITRNAFFEVGEIVTLRNNDGSERCKWDNGSENYWIDNDCFEHISQNVHKKGFMKKLSIMATKLVDADVKAFVEAGILDSELNITEEGRDFVLTQVLNDNKAKYATEAKKLVADARKEKKGE